MENIPQPQLYDESGQPVTLDPSLIPQALASGKYGFKKGESVPVISPQGTIQSVSADEAPVAFRQGFHYEPLPSQQERAMAEKYGNDPVEQLKAGAEGAARGASLGLSDVVEKKLGVSPEAMAARQKYNPATSLVSNIVGVAAPILLTGGAAAPAEGAAGAAARLLATDLIPSAAVSRLGAGVASKVGAAIGSEAAQSLAGRIATSAIQYGAGSAVEGAFYGAGNAISESTLGDTELTGEKLLSHVGMGAVLGGGLGAAFGGIAGSIPKMSIAESLPSLAAQETVPGVEGAVAKQSSGSLVDTLDHISAPSEAKESLIDGLTKLKSNSKEIIQAAQDIGGAPVLESQISGSDFVHNLDSMLMQSPGPVGVARQQLAQKGIDLAEQSVGRSLGEGTDLSLAEVGNQIKGKLVQKLETESAPISALYDELKQTYQAIPVSQTSLSRIAQNVSKLEDVTLSQSSPQAALARRVVEDLPKLENVDQIKRYKTLLRQSISPTASPAEKNVARQIADKLTDFEENSIIKFAEREMKTPEAKQKILDLILQRKTANAAYTEFREKMSELGNVLGKKRIDGASSFSDFIENLTPEKLASKLFAKNNSEFLQFFSKEFPEETQLLMQFQKSQIRQAATKDGVLQMGKIFREVDKLSPEVKEIMFNDQERRTLKAAQTYMDAMPKNINPSGTSKALAYQDLIFHPISGAINTAKDISALATLKSLVKTNGAPQQALLQTLRKIEEISQTTSRGIESAVRGFLVNSSLTSAQAAASTNYILKKKLDEPKVDRSRKNRYESFNRRYAELTNTLSNPQSLTEKVSENTHVLSQMAPKVTQALILKSMQAAQFLYDKAPKNPLVGYGMGLGSQHWQPGDFELAKWERYVAAAHDPMTVVKDFKKGTLSLEGVEALKTLYPKIYSEMKTVLVDHMSDLKHALPYQKRLQLSQFFGVPIDASSQPQFMAHLQSIFQSTETANAPAPSGGVGARADHLSVSSRAKTQTEKILTRT